MLKTQSFSNCLPNASVKDISVYKHDYCGICLIVLLVSNFKSPLAAVIILILIVTLLC